MIPTPAEILERIKGGALLPLALIGALDHDVILDVRDGAVDFEAQWTRCYNSIESRWQEGNLDKDTAATAEAIRREAFLSVSNATSQHEIASYVSDDFDIMVRGSILGVNDEFLNGLWGAYSRNEIPRADRRK